VPRRPAAWLMTAAWRRALDRLRREDGERRRLPLLITGDERGPALPEDDDAVGDERLRLFFACCHPALAADARTALMLRFGAGLTTGEIARLFLVPEPTMAARLTRAKKKIAQAGIPLRAPAAADLEIGHGLELLGHVRGSGPPGCTASGRYTLEALIAAEHAGAAGPADTDWCRIAALYAELEERTGSPVVRLNRAVAVAEAGDPAAGLALTDGLEAALPAHHLLPAVRADLLRRLGRPAQARAAYDAALRLVRTEPEREHPRRRRASL
ncbi:sigma factor-like helix-turn-helix DNA-binding protein, partial [Dactylosporangium sp. NPDC000555]|uniref:sigma factor-like helix-turn-helix DNA-binding protein n=1 Tax=Dactylosporangium sp. NPDC000555 TaxID=3154260 RepID=UPI003333D85D